jgi:hypothetical protein
MTFGPSRFFEAEQRSLGRSKAILAGLVLVAAACAAGTALPAPRPLVVRSGARVYAEEGRLSEIDVWVRNQQENIVVDPTFMIVEKRSGEPTYPWEGLRIAGDTAEVLVFAGAPDAGSILAFYGHYHMMDVHDRLEEFLPEAVGLEGYELERAILARVSDAWLYGRAAFDTPPFGPLDELLFSNENGYLDAFILTARPEEFEEARSAWRQNSPEQAEEYRRWFTETFESEPPGLRPREQA